MPDRFFTAPDGADEPTIWEATDAGPAVVVRRAELPAPHADLLWRVLTGVLCADDETVEQLCEAQHIAYEHAAVNAGWETQERSRRQWIHLPKENKQTMRASVRALLAALRGEQ